VVLIMLTPGRPNELIDCQKSEFLHCSTTYYVSEDMMELDTGVA